MLRPTPRAIAPSHPKPPTADEALRVLRALPPFSAVARHVLQLVSREDIAFRKLAESIKADAALGADMLRVANSAFFGSRYPVTGVLHAIAMLGLDRIRSLVTTVALKNYTNPACGRAALARCWRHNLGCALISEQIARRTGVDTDFAYTAGLLHDIGRLAMIAAWPERYTALLDSAMCEPLHVLELERQELGIDHARAGHFLINDWKLPSELAAIAERHHAPLVEGLGDGAIVVHLSCPLADRLGFPAAGQLAAEDPGPEADLPPRFRESIGDLDDLRLWVAERINAFECCFAG
ncbi:MAG: HDOD domain-containing protein [Bryobacteraceae bacterium]